ncbi:macrophage mannose receptor 1-like [Myripristis murdjan]|uniref:macrophage mannose receptor 1-like n=1 Tax=Myripristis murdjan TaxID=586833 RepID=UPI001175F75E|nr:macrophage mannose receptor 1-like [Myripristis murdjan]
MAQLIPLLMLLGLGFVHSAMKYVPVVNMTANWEDAKKYCQGNHTGLAIIRTEEDYEAVGNLNLNVDVWIGLRRNTNDTNKTWKWSDEEDYVYTNWENGHDPSDPNFNSYLCVISSKQQGWRPLLCVTTSQHAVCQNVSHSTPTRKKGYKLYQTTYTQHDSEQYCKNQSMEIATITSEEEQEEFDAIASPTSWIGLKRKDENSPWKWTNGDPVPLVKHTHTGECVKLSSKTWEAVNCSTKKNFLCYEDEDPTTSYGLQFYSESKSWIGALNHCLSQNTTLVQITNQSVQDAVSQHLKNQAVSGGVWIGLERPIFGCNVDWLWYRGLTVNFTQWNSNFPTDVYKHHCGKIIKSGEPAVFTWLDASCFQKLPFICQNRTSTPG